MSERPSGGVPAGGVPFATDPATLARLFGDRDDLLPLWVAEPAVPLAPAVVAAVRGRAATGWYGYEARSPALGEAFATWTRDRHGWDLAPLHVELSPSVATSLAVLLAHLCEPGDGVVLQPPVFTDFKPLVRDGGLRVEQNPLALADGRYTFDLEQLDAVVAPDDVRALVLCSPHNPVGRVWTESELRALAEVCAAHDVTVLADELHADLALAPHAFVPFARAAAGTGVRWAAMHGALKTFGLAGLADTLLLTDDDEMHAAWRAASNRYHLTRNNVVGLAATAAAYAAGGPWLDDLLADTAARAARLADGLPAPLALTPLEGTYLAWLDLRGLGLDVPELGRWLVEEAGLALSPGHWFGRQGAGFARMTIAVEDAVLDEAVARLAAAVARS